MIDMAKLLAQEEFAEAVLTLPGDLPRQVMDEFTRGWRMREVLAVKEQEQVAATQPDSTWVDGIGQRTMSISADAFHFWGQRLGYDCWKDRGFRREFARDNPAVRVKSVARKTMVKVDGMRGARSGLLVANRFGVVD